MTNEEFIYLAVQLLKCPHEQDLELMKLPHIQGTYDFISAGETLGLFFLLKVCAHVTHFPKLSQFFRKSGSGKVEKLLWHEAPQASSKTHCYC